MKKLTLKQQVERTWLDNGLAEVRKHAQVSISNNHYCHDCFCCACMDFLVPLESDYAEFKKRHTRKAI